MQFENFFKNLADETRLRLLALVFVKKKVCVFEFQEALDLSQPKISRHLSYLRKSKILKISRVGTWVIYELNDRMPDWAEKILISTVRELLKKNPYITDQRRYRKTLRVT